MPVTDKGRFVYAPHEELNNWFGTGPGKSEPDGIASEDEVFSCGSQAGPFVCSSATDEPKAVIAVRERR